MSTDNWVSELWSEEVKMDILYGKRANAWNCNRFTKAVIAHCSIFSPFKNVFLLKMYFYYAYKFYTCFIMCIFITMK